MSTTAPTILLCLFVINLGIAFGAGLYEHRIVTPDWVLCFVIALLRDLRVLRPL